MSTGAEPAVAAAVAVPSAVTPDLPQGEFAWHRAIDVDDLPEGRVTTVTVGHRTLAITRSGDVSGALDNRCPHQGGPLGEGSIERGWLRCPWHGYDYSPCNGRPPPGFSDAPAAYRTELRGGVVHVALPLERPRGRTVADVVVETMVAWGSAMSSGWWGTPTWDWRMHCGSRRSAGTSPMWASVTRARRPSRPRPTAS